MNTTILEKLKAEVDLRGGTANEGLSQGEVHLAEERLGYPLPDLLRELYIKVGNGGFGPGKGLLPLIGEQYPHTIVSLVEADNVTDQYGILEEYLPLFHWEGNNYGYVHVVEDEHILLLDDDYLLDEFDRNRPLSDQYPVIADSLEALFQAWLAGEPLISEAYKTLSN
jgi:hypothetical protein